MASTTFSTTLQTLRKEKKVTQEQLAVYLGVSPQAVSKWENGSFPEGDLLPRIADYFSVSIDYLYGRGQRSASINQTVFDYLREVIKKETDSGKYMPEVSNFWDELYNIIWAAQICPWSANNEYFSKTVSNEKTARAASVLFNNQGYSYMNLDKGNGFYFLLRDEGNGETAKWLRDSEKVRGVFELLAHEDNVKILLYLYSLGSDEYADVDTIAHAAGVKREQVEKVLKYMLSDISEETEWKYLLNKIKIAGQNGESETAYSVDQNFGGLVIALFVIADTLVHIPHGFNMQIANRTKPWIDKNSTGNERKE